MDDKTVVFEDEDEEEITVVEIGIPGPHGPPGAPGADGKVSDGLFELNESGNYIMPGKL